MTNQEPENLTPPPMPDPPKPEPKPAAPLVDAAKVRAQAEYFARNPEILDATLQELEKAGHVHVNARLDAMQREIDLRDIIAETGLTKEDMAFIQANTRDEMATKARALKARLTASSPAPAQSGPEKTIIPVGHMGAPAMCFSGSVPVVEVRTSSWQLRPRGKSDCRWLPSRAIRWVRSGLRPISASVSRAVRHLGSRKLTS
jgi:hypothetical protein